MLAYFGQYTVCDQILSILETNFARTENFYMLIFG